MAREKFDADIEAIIEEEAKLWADRLIAEDKAEEEQESK